MRAGLKPTMAFVFLGFQNDTQAPGLNVGWAADGAERYAPITGNIDLGDRPAPAALTIELDQSVNQRGAGELLKMRIERRSHRQAAAIQFVFAVFRKQPAANLFGEELGRRDMCAARPDIHDERLRFGRRRFFRRDVAVLGHLADDPVPPLGRSLFLAERIIVVRTFRKSSKVRRFLDRQIFELFVEVRERRCRDAVRVHAEINFIEIKFENLVLGIGALDANGEDGFLDLTFDRTLVGQ